MATYKAFMRPALEYASCILDRHQKLQVMMQNVALRTATGCTQDTNIQHLHDKSLILRIHKHLQLHASKYKKKKHNIHHTPYTNMQYTSQSKAKNTIFNNGRYTPTIPTDPHTIPTTDIKTNMRHILSIVSRHLAIRGNHNILRTPPPHFSSSEEILPPSTRHTLVQLRSNNSPFLKSYFHTVDAKSHPSQLCPLCNTHTRDTHYVFNGYHIRTTLSPLYCGKSPPE